MYGGWQLGHMSTYAFVKKHNEFAQVMRSVDPDIKLVAVGDPGEWDEMMLSHIVKSMFRKMSFGTIPHLINAHREFFISAFILAFC